MPKAFRGGFSSSLSGTACAAGASRDPGPRSDSYIGGDLCGEGLTIPASLRNFNGADLYAGRGLKNNAFSPEMRTAVIDWILSLGVAGYAGRPRDWLQSA